MIMDISRAIKNDVTGYVWKALKVDGWLPLLDVVLVVVFILLIFTEAKIVTFHVAFFLLTFGAFFWKFHAFAFRTIFWVTGIAVVIFTGIFASKIPFEEILELPMLSLILLLVYVIAGQRSRAVDALRKRTDDLSMLLEVSNQIALNQSLEPLLGLILDHLKTVVDYENASIFKLDGEVLTSLIYRGLTSQNNGIPLHLSLENTRLGRKLLIDQDPVNIADIWDNSPLARDLRKAFGDQLENARGKVRSWMGVPLISKNRVIGILALQHSEPIRYYSPTHADLVLGFSNQASVAIETARHFEQGQALAAIEERQRLARDLHDAVSQTLFSASLSAEVLPRLWERNPTEARLCLEEVYQLNRSALTEMRTLLLELRPEVLTEMDLGDLLSQLTETVSNRFRLPVDLATEKLDSLPSDVQIALYRISQEALNNVVKHAVANQAAVYLRSKNLLISENGDEQRKGLELRITDDGQGFDPNRVSSASMGLSIMRERAEAIGADFRIESEIGHGTEMVVVWMGAS